jgi:hypothetical protein
MTVSTSTNQTWLGMLATGATYTKRQAEQKLNELREERGGLWNLYAERGKWGVYQTRTRDEERKEQVRRQAESALHPKRDWFAQDGHLSIYKTRDQLKEKLDAWAARFAADPAYALSWGTENCQNATDYKIVSEIIAYHEAGHDDQDICRYIEAEAQRKVNGERLSVSSSPMSNLMEQALRVSLVKFAREMRAWLDHRVAAAGTLYADAEGLL